MYDCGLVQAAKPRLSKLHCVVALESSTEKVKLADVEVDGFGGNVLIVTVSPVASISQLKNAGDGSTLPAESVALTSKV